MAKVAERLEKLAAAGLPVAPLTLCATEADVAAAAQTFSADISLRYEGARLRAATSITDGDLDSALAQQRQALDRALMLGLVDAEPQHWIIQETPAATLVEIDSRDAMTGEATDGELTAQAEATLGQPLKLTVAEGKIFDAEPLALSPRQKFTALVDLVEQGHLSQAQGLKQISALDLEELLHPRLAPGGENLTIASGINASPGAVAGRIYFSARDAIDVAQTSGAGPVLLVRKETTPEDIRAITVAAGVVTRAGGMTSHAAVIARGLGKPCVVGVRDMDIDPESRTLKIGDQLFYEGDWLTIDGTSGRVLPGRVETQEPTLPEAFDKIMGWCDATRSMDVLANAETVAEVELALHFGAEGIGLCRTEHMFLNAERLGDVQRMILAETVDAREAVLKELEPLVQAEFLRLLMVLQGKPVTVRLLDPPLHEFLPSESGEIEQLAEATGLGLLRIQRRLEALREANPMMGLRGCRLGIMFPEIYESQVRALMAACRQARKQGVQPHVDIMLPLISSASEVAILRERLEPIVTEDARQSIGIGAMIETPRACLRAEEIAQDCDFFSFGTNDLTQLAFGLSRDDAGTFMPEYRNLGLLAYNPFRVLDEQGVGELLAIAVERGRLNKADMPMGLCGEQGAEPASVTLAHDLGFNSVSCSPYRVPIARLAAAQAALQDETA
ncbi:MAG: pyruvate, phosphate dikinase [Alphaproteobacteria bacterium TMED89]|nr:pyruvate, phosphate dikinase [Rhodospirillaceae bacterium]RPH17365.1 MAG: pyruvate, phosphate dikinase [Alphaproteobacteria bacterium TMED89]